MSSVPRVRHLAWLVAAIVCTSYVLATAAEVRANTRPNFVIITSDDLAWPFYGFMQKWQRAQRAAGLVGPAYEGDIDLGTSRIDRFQLILPNDDDIVTGLEGDVIPPKTPQDPSDGKGWQYTYRMEDLITPALDRVAEAGAFFPYGQNGASKCQPGFASIMTGLYRADNDSRVEGGIPLLDPILPEYLPGFAWSPTNNHVIALPSELVPPQNAETGDYYLTMAAGKYQRSLTYVFEDNGDERKPFDRTLSTGSEGIKGRKMIEWDSSVVDAQTGLVVRSADNRPLDQIKDFLECTQCDKKCMNLPADPVTGELVDCSDDPNEVQPPNCGCALKSCEQPMPQGEFDPDSPRLAAWKASCQDLPGAVDKPFMLLFSPYIPHLGFAEKVTCEDYMRTDADCQSSELSYGAESAYCAMRCTDGKTIGAPCGSPGDPQCGSGETCEMKGLSCEEWAWHLERNALLLDNADANESSLNRRDVYNGILGDDRRPACDDDIIDGNCDPTNVADEWSGNRFTKRGDILRFINGFDRSIDELIITLKEKGMWQNTVLLYITDNGFQITSSKSKFNENGYRTPIVMRDPYRTFDPGTEPEMLDDLCAGVAGCRSDPVIMSDLLGSICDFLDPNTGECMAQQCAMTGDCSYRTFPPPSHGETKVARSLRPDTNQASQIGRFCVFPEEDDDEAREEFGTHPSIRDKFVRCHYGEDLPPNGDGQGTGAGKGGYLLAEVVNDRGTPGDATDDVIHRCKIYDECAGGQRSVYDLTCDPNERRDLSKTGNLGLYDEEYTAGGNDYCGDFATNQQPFCSTFVNGDKDETIGLLNSLMYYTLIEKHGWTRSMECEDQPYCLDANGDPDMNGCPEVLLVLGPMDGQVVSNPTMQPGVLPINADGSIATVGCIGTWANGTTGDTGPMGGWGYVCGAQDGGGAATSIPLAVGDNQIWIMMEDSAGNSAVEEYTVTYTP